MKMILKHHIYISISSSGKPIATGLCFRSSYLADKPKNKFSKQIHSAYKLSSTQSQYTYSKNIKHSRDKEKEK